MMDMKFKSNVAIIIINWNGFQDTIECLESLYQIDYPNYDVILVDNASSNNSVEKIKEYCNGNAKVKSKFFKYESTNKPINLFEINLNDLKSDKLKKTFLNGKKELILIKNDKNYGFAGGNNIGIKYVLNSTLNHDYILLLNNDTVVEKKFLNELLEVANSNDKIGFLGPKTYYYDYNGNSNVINFAGGKLNMNKGCSYHIGAKEIDSKQHDKIKEVDYVEGSCMLIRKRILEQIGVLNINYFAYWEETDLCIRGLKKGYTSMYVPKSQIWHKVSSSNIGEIKTYYLTRNRIWFMKKYSNHTQFILFLIYFLLYEFWRETIVYLFIFHDLKKIRCYLKSIYHGFNQKSY